MFKLKDIPNISKEFKIIYGKYFDLNADPEKTIPLVEAFLDKYPYYPEAYNFLAVLFIANGQLTKAMKCIKALEKIDPWWLHGIFDKAEILIGLDNYETGISAFIEGIKAYSAELTNGIDNFITASTPKQKAKFRKSIFKAISNYSIDTENDEIVFDELMKELNNWQFEKLK